MSDVLTKAQRSYNMSKIRSSNTSSELKFRKQFKDLGFKYQQNNIYGKPDFFNKQEKIAIFIDGCFWHKCQYHFKVPSTNTDFWMKKINKNVQRDKVVTKRLKKEGYRVIRIWEHQIKANSKIVNDILIG